MVIMGLIVYILAILSGMLAIEAPPSIRADSRVFITIPMYYFFVMGIGYKKYNVLFFILDILYFFLSCILLFFIIP